MKPRSLPLSYNSQAEFMARVAETVNQILAGMHDGGTSANRPTSPQVGMRYFDEDLDAMIYWSGAEWRWCGNDEPAP